MSPIKPFHLPWNQYDKYWICLWPDAELHPAGLVTQLITHGFQKRRADREYYVCLTSKRWAKTWTKVRELLTPLVDDVQVAVIAGDSEPDEKQISFSHKPVQAVDNIVTSLWLGDALLRGDVMCYLQPVVTQRDKTVGFESFARVKSEDGQVINGGDIVTASRALGIEYALDRHLHVQAIKTYIAGNLSGFLFVNFFPGFIQRPEVYLEGLSEAVRMHGIISKHVVLDFTECENDHDMQHVKRVTEYCRSKGYAIALDDVESIDNAKKLIPVIKPDFVKLSRRMANMYQRMTDVELLRDIIELSHNHGAVVIAEGVETDAAYEKLKSLGVDMFQGYLFSPPMEIKPAVSPDKTGT